MQKASLRRIFIIAGIVSLLVSYVGIWLQFIADPVERTGSDFIAFYAAGRVARQAGPAHVYDPLLIQQIQEQEVGFDLVPGQVLLYNHLPFLVPVLQIIVSPDYVVSFYRWIVLFIAFFIASLGILSQTLKQAGIDRPSTLVAAGGAFLFLPLFFSLMNGQDTGLLLLGAAIWMYGLLSGKEYLAGLGLSLTTVRPHVALVLAIPMLFHSRKVFLGFVAGSGVLGLVSLLVVGFEGAWKYVNVILTSAGGEWYGIKQNVMYNLIGLLTRIAPQLEPGAIRTFGWIVYGLTIIGLCILWFKTKDPRNGMIGLSVTLALFVVPHLHFHDLTLLLIPLYEVVRKSKEGRIPETSLAVTIPILLSLLLLISNISPFLQYTTPYLILLALVMYFYYQKRAFRSPLFATDKHG
jgi:hypothetical protein